MAEDLAQIYIDWTLSFARLVMEKAPEDLRDEVLFGAACRLAVDMIQRGGLKDLVSTLHASGVLLSCANADSLANSEVAGNA